MPKITKKMIANPEGDVKNSFIWLSDALRLAPSGWILGMGQRCRADPSFIGPPIDGVQLQNTSAAASLYQRALSTWKRPSHRMRGISAIFFLTQKSSPANVHFQQASAVFRTTLNQKSSSPLSFLFR